MLVNLPPKKCKKKARPVFSHTKLLLWKAHRALDNLECSEVSVFRIEKAASTEKATIRTTSTRLFPPHIKKGSSSFFHPLYSHLLFWLINIKIQKLKLGGTVQQTLIGSYYSLRMMLCAMGWTKVSKTLYLPFRVYTQVGKEIQV